MFKRAYVEITNLCNLRCSFCPGTRRPPGRMSPERFRLAARALRGHTRYVYLHVMGEPLLHPELGEILDICAGEDLRACVTTTAPRAAGRGIWRRTWRACGRSAAWRRGQGSSAPCGCGT